MLDLPTIWRQLLSQPWLQAGVLSVLATILALALWTIAPTVFTSLNWALYDAWMRHRISIPVSPTLTIVTRDRASEEELGNGPWDRAVIARAITAAHEQGASVIGLDLRLEHTGAMHPGGVASEALLLEAIKQAGPVVIAHSSDAQTTSDMMMQGHLHVSDDLDHVARVVPLVSPSGPDTIPAFGHALYEQARHDSMRVAATPPFTDNSSLLVNYAGQGTVSAFPTIPFSAVWSAIDRHDIGRLQEWFHDKIVVFLLTPPEPDTWLLPTGAASTGAVIHLHVLNMLLTQNQLTPAGPAAGAVCTLLLAGSAGWMLLQYPVLLGLLLAAGSIAVYTAVNLLALVAGLVMPVALPVTATMLTIIGATTWNQLTAHHRLVLAERQMLRIQQDASAVREALVLQETRTETLQEDLAAAHAAVTRSAGQHEDLRYTAENLRTQLAEAQSQEERTRQKLDELERQLESLRAAERSSGVMGNAEFERLQDECRSLGIITQNAGLLRLYHDLKKIARSPLTVLLLGEPGTGKELFARAVHRLSPRTGRTFIAVNMAAISPELFESELFGHVKGSFTGATGDRRGYFELANHGTIFLDEIGDLRLDHQSKLLRVLQEKSFYRVGATTPTTVDVRIVAATNRDLQRGVSDGWFREDLYFRLAGLVVRLPPLRKRTGDIPLIADVLLAELAAQMNKPVPRLSNDALRALTERDWKGNVRELRHCLEQAVTLNEGPVLTRAALRLTEDGPRPGETGKQILPDPASDAAVLHCLRQHGFDMQATATTLGWDRSTVTQRLKGLCFQALVESSGDQTKAALSIAGDPGHLRTVELKLLDYYTHLQSVIDPFATPDEALLDCKRRFKNLPDRHFASVESLVRQHFRQRAGTRPASIRP